MEQLIGIFLHLDTYLAEVIRDYGVWTYLILFIVIFCETGLVVTPFLPGDSLLFAAGTFAAIGAFDVYLLMLILFIAGVLGNTSNYMIGKFFGRRIPFRDDARILKKAYLVQTEMFFQKYGGMAVIFSRFAPIIRTFAPFLAGLGKMSFVRYTVYNVLGASAWVGLFVLGGYYFGNIPAVRKNFTLVIMAIVAVSLIPSFIGYLRHRRASSQSSAK